MSIIRKPKTQRALLYFIASACEKSKKKTFDEKDKHLQGFYHLYVSFQLPMFFISLDSRPTLKETCIDNNLILSINKRQIYTQVQSPFKITCHNSLNTISDFLWLKDEKVFFIIWSRLACPKY